MVSEIWAWQTEIFDILDNFLPIYPPWTKKINILKKWTTEYIIILQMCTKNDSHMMYGSWDMECNGQNSLLFWTVFFTFYPTNNPKNQILKKWKNCPEILSFYICVQQIKIIWCMVPETWSMMDQTFCHVGLFFDFLPPNNPKNQNFEKMKKSLEILLFYTSVP